MCDEPPIALAGSSVEDERPGLERGFDAVDRIPGTRPLRISIRRQDDAHGDAGMRRDALGRESSLGAGQQQLPQVEIEQGQDDLRLRIAEAAVELERHRSLGGEHQPGIERAAIGPPLGAQPGDRRLQHAFPHPSHDVRIEVIHRRVAAHASRVRTQVAVPQPLVVPRRGQDRDPLAVDDGDHAQLLPFEERFDHDPIAGRLKRPINQHRVDRVLGLGLEWRRSTHLCRPPDRRPSPPGARRPSG